MLWKARISSTFVYSENKKLRKQLDEANREGVRWAIIFGGDELDKNIVNIKDLLNRTEETVSTLLTHTFSWHFGAMRRAETFRPSPRRLSLLDQGTFHES